MDSDVFMSDFQRYAEDHTMPAPNIENEPHILISRVRKYYLRYITKLLSENYDKAYKLPGNSLHLPSGITKCAQLMEIEAARSCMIVDLYRKTMLVTIGHLKSANKQGKIHKQLLKTCKESSLLNKRTQTSFSSFKENVCKCQCTCKTEAKPSNFPNNQINRPDVKPPIIFNEMIKVENDSKDILYVKEDIVENSVDLPLENQKTSMPDTSIFEKPEPDIQDNDDVMLQLEMLFNGDHNDEDLFDSILCSNEDNNDTNKKANVSDGINVHNNLPINKVGDQKTLEDRLAALESSGVLPTQTEKIIEQPKQNKHITKKWICEIYFRKLKLFERLDEIRDINRKKYKRIHDKYYELFGADSDDEEMMSPLVENRQFILSCQERFAPWIVEALTPYYVKGRIKSKALFKSTAKHLIKIIYEINKYPKQYEVTSFVQDFLKNHSVIRCEADFKSFTIPNYTKYSTETNMYY